MFRIRKVPGPGLGLGAVSIAKSSGCGMPCGRRASRTRRFSSGILKAGISVGRALVFIVAWSSRMPGSGCFFRCAGCQHAVDLALREADLGEDFAGVLPEPRRMAVNVRLGETPP